jgi:hypothetical protein
MAIAVGNAMVDLRSTHHMEPDGLHLMQPAKVESIPLWGAGVVIFLNRE